MSFPFIIWTVQRSGGTSLTELLMQTSEFKSAEHEPFNWRRSKPRQFGAIAQQWSETEDEEALSKALTGIFAERYLIKHCYELHEMPFNVRLMRAAAATDYRHILLMRRDELSRLISKYIAESHGTWFANYASTFYADVASGARKLKPLPIDKMVHHFRHCENVTNKVRKQALGLGVDLHEVYYEDLYVGERAPRMAKLMALMNFIGFSAAAIEQNQALIEEKIFAGGQDTRSMMPYVPNLTKVVKALETAGYRRDTSATLAAIVPRDEPPPTDSYGANLDGAAAQAMGKLQLDFLRRAGLKPRHRVLDMGCGTLATALPLVAYLDPERYFGIEAEKRLIEEGYAAHIEDDELSDRLPRPNLYTSRLFLHQRLAEGVIDFGLCVSVMPNLPANFVRICLENSGKYFKPGGKLYVSFFELADDQPFAQPHTRPSGLVTHGHKEPYHAYRRDMIDIAKGLGWRARYIGEWSDPRGQQMVEYERL